MAILIVLLQNSANMHKVHISKLMLHDSSSFCLHFVCLFLFGEREHVKEIEEKQRKGEGDEREREREVKEGDERESVRWRRVR